ncbi:MAG: AAA family ATPase [Anaerolineae bacterium]
MRITQVDLENVKSYTRARVSFAPGTNAICGHNGAGKSTLLEAIGFALFGYLAVSQADLVREGEKVATVTVHVEDRDGRCYQVVRKCGSYSQHYVYDPELDQKLTDGSRESMIWLQEFLGLDPSADLAVLFRDAVGVPQGLLTAAFLETPSRRKDIFNPLLRVDEYERVWEGLREPERRLNQMITSEETRIAGLAAQVEPLPQLRERRAALHSEIEGDLAAKAEQEADLTEVTAHLAVLAERKDQMDQLDKAIAQAEATVKATRVRLQSSEEALAASQRAEKVVNETKEGHEAYLAAQETLAALESRRAERDQFRSEQQDVAKTLAVTQERYTGLAQDMEAIEEAKATMARLKPEVDRQTELEAALERAKAKVQQLTVAEHDLSRESSRLSELEQAHDEASVGFKAREEKIAELKALGAELDALRQERERLSEKMLTLEHERAHVAAQIDAAGSRLTSESQALEREEARLHMLNSKLTAIRERWTALAKLDEAITLLRAETEALEADQQELTAEVASHRTRAAHVAAQLAMLSASEEPECPVCGQPLTPEHRAKLRTDYEEQAEAHRRAEAEARAALEEVTSRRQRKAQEIESLEGERKSLPRLEEVMGLEQQIEEQSRSVRARKETVEAVAEALDTEQERLAALEAQIEELKPQLDQVTAARDAQLARVQAREVEVHALPRQADVETLEADLALQRKTLAEVKQRIVELETAPDELARLKAEIEALGDPRHAYERAVSIADREAIVKEALEQARGTIRLLEEDAEQIAAQLKAYADLEVQLASERQALTDHAEAHERYLEHAREAGALEARQKAVEDLLAALKSAESVYTDQVEARATVAADYDADLHQSLLLEQRELDTALARCEERIQQRHAQQEEVVARIERLETAEKDLTAARTRREELDETHRLLTYLRSVLRSAGPEITRALVEIISLHADRLYADIMQTTGSRLRWTEDYDVVLKTQGRERTFQQLSGGEQMAAALAVRLALLRETSTIDMAFFDEPTANLDAERRFNLARQILNVKGFSQLFVISHDDTFEQDTDHIVRVWKENGVSFVDTGEPSRESAAAFGLGEE